MYFIYILTNKIHTTLYIGVTNNLIRRMYEHKNKLAKGFTDKYNIDQLIYYETADDPLTAIQREKALKNLVRRKKEQLINDFNPDWSDLFEDILV